MKRIFTSIIMLLISVTAFAQNPAPCSDLFFSEYIEGSNNNKVLEIYNPSTMPVNLTNYKVWISYNGGASIQSIYLQGTLNAGAVFILANSSASAPILALADQVSGALDFNGNDAVVLIDTATNDTLDIIGVIAPPAPAISWPVGTGTTVDQTLTRMAGVNNGQLDWVIGASEWNVFPLNDFTQLDSHTMTPCPVQPPTVFLVNATQNVNEGAGTVTIELGITNADANPTSVTLTLSDISATITQDYDLAGNPVIVTFPGGSAAIQTVTVSIIDDANIETSESFNVDLSNATNNATISTSNEVVTIADNDTPGPEVFLISTTQSVIETAGSITIQVGINNPNANPTSVTLTLSDLTASLGQDYNLAGSQTVVTFPGGSSVMQTVSVTIISDAITELDETFVATLNNPDNNATITAASDTITIINVEINSYIGFLKGVDSVSESMSTYSAQLEIFSAPPTSAPTSVTVSLISVQSTATQGVDFIFNDTIITWPAGSSDSQYAIFNLIDDAINETTEHFVLTLSNFTNNSAFNTNLFLSTTINIIDNDPIGISNILNDKNVLLFPNPANDNSILITNGQFNYFEIRDAAGRILQAVNIQNQTVSNIDITDFSAGIYFVCIHNASQTEVLKLVKQ